MKKLFSAILLYIVLLGSLFFLNAPTASAACQIIYGGGEICQNQKDIINTYKLPTPSPTTTQFAVPPTHTLPSTGASTWSLLLIGLSGIGGALLLLL